jgi:hypothetical protein
MNTRFTGHGKSIKNAKLSTALKGNKNASGKRVRKIMLANTGGFISGVLHRPEHRATATAKYEKLGMGKTGYKLGTATRRIGSVGFLK